MNNEIRETNEIGYKYQEPIPSEEKDENQPDSTKKKWNKKKISIIAVVLIVMMAVLAVTMMMRKNNKNKYEEVLESYNETKEVDDYTITLDGAVYYKELELVYCKFEVSSESGKVDVFYDDNNPFSFGENGRFSLCLESDRGETDEVTYDGNALIFYTMFELSDYDEDAPVLYLFDEMRYQNTQKNPAAKYELKSSKNVLHAQKSGMDIYISPMAVKVYANNELETKQIEVGYSDGKFEKSVDWDKMIAIEGYSQSQSGSDYEERYLLEEVLDIKKVTAVKWNGEKFTVMNEE